jgi:hypothetical protein
MEPAFTRILLKKYCVVEYVMGALLLLKVIVVTDKGFTGGGRLELQEKSGIFNEFMPHFLNC